MKSYGHLWELLISSENLRAGWEEFRRHHSTEPKVLKFESKLERELEAIHSELVAGTWRPGGYHRFMITDPKPRLISCVRRSATGSSITRSAV